MRHSNRGPFRNQVNFLRQQFLQDGDLPFTNVLTEGVVAQALAAVTGWRRGKARAPRKLVPTARPASACPNRFSRRWPVRQDRPWKPTWTRSGCGKVGTSTCSMVRP